MNNLACKNIDISEINPYISCEHDIDNMTVEELRQLKKDYGKLLKRINQRLKELQPKTKRKKTKWSDKGEVSNSSDAFYTREQAEQLISYFLERDNVLMATICTFGLNSGNRIGDIIKMPVEMIVTTRGKIKERVYINEEKNGFSRWLYFNEATKMALHYYYSLQKNKRSFDYFFTSNGNNKAYEIDEATGERIQKGLRYESVRQYMEKANKECFPDGHFRTHTFRKATCNIIARENGELFRQRTYGDMVASVFLGHSSLSTTERFYLSMSEQERKEVQLSLNLGLEVWNKYIESKK